MSQLDKIEPCRSNGTHEMYLEKDHTFCRRCGYKPTEAYELLTQQLGSIRAEHGEDSEEEEACLETMDLVWREMSREDRGKH